MPRLRVRIELNRGGVGVPLEKLASVVQQAQSFFRMLGEDVHIDQSQGEWLGFDFDHESLNFTAEFVGPVSQEQVSAFHSAFDGTTGLRRATIAQFARIADAIEEDEVIGFGLYLNEGEDPAEWRCLSRRDALRIAEEIRVLLGTGETGGPETHLPAVAETHTGARYLFGRRERGTEVAKLAGAVREVEASLSKRISRLEGEVAEHTGQIQDLRSKSIEAEQSMGRLLTAVEGFCEQAAQRLETATAAPAHAAAAARVPIEAPKEVGASVPATGEAREKADVPVKQEAAAQGTAIQPVPAEPAAKETLPKTAPTPAIPVWATAVSTGEPFADRPLTSWWRSPTAISVALGVSLVLLAMLLWPSSSPKPAGNSAVTSAAEPVASPGGPAGKAEETAPPARAAASQAEPAQAAAKTTAVATTAPAVAAPAPPKTESENATAVSEPAVIGATRIELEATEPSWISIRGGDGTTQVARLIEPGKVQTVDIREPAILRAGNAGGLTVRANGKSLGPLGPHGAVREVEFRDGQFKLVPVR